MINHWLDYIHSLAVKYSLYISTRNRWRDDQAGFESEEQFVASQKKLANEIQKIDDEIKPKIEEVFKEKYPTFKLLGYDSGFASEEHERVGVILVDDEQEKYNKDELEQHFFQSTEVNVIVNFFSTMPEEIKKRMKSNG